MAAAIMKKTIKQRYAFIGPEHPHSHSLKIMEEI